MPKSRDFPLKLGDDNMYVSKDMAKTVNDRL